MPIRKRIRGYMSEAVAVIKTFGVKLDHSHSSNANKLAIHTLTNDSNTSNINTKVDQYDTYSWSVGKHNGESDDQHLEAPSIVVKKAKNWILTPDEGPTSNLRLQKAEVKIPAGTITGKAMTADPGTVTPVETESPRVYQRKAPGDGPALFALLIGINTYNAQSSYSESTSPVLRDDSSNPPPSTEKPLFSNLRGAVADAEAFREYLVSDLGVPKEHINFLRDKQATREGIVQSLKALKDDDSVKPGDVILIFYAGHGAQALAPRRWSNIATGGVGKVELLIPCDYGDPANNHEYMGIPDYTLAALLNDISSKKGDNITVIFDCCHSASALRGGQDPIPQPVSIVRTGPSLTYHVPDDLDENILKRHNTRALTVQPHLKHLGSVSYVFFSACASFEQAREEDSRGCFTKALLTLLKQPGNRDLVCSQVASRLPRIQGQSPQCEGVHQNSRPIFHMFNHSLAKKYFVIKAVSDARGVAPYFHLNAGDVHGIEKGDELAVFKSKSDDFKNCCGIVTVDKLFAGHSEVKPSSPFFLPCDSAFALLTKRSLLPAYGNCSGRFNLYIENNDSTLISRVKTLNGTVNIVPNCSTAHVALSIDKAVKLNSKTNSDYLRFDVVDSDLFKLNTFVDLKPSFAPDTDEDLERILEGLSHYYSHLKRTGNSTDLCNGISVSFFKVDEKKEGILPRFVKSKLEPNNLHENGMINLEVDEEDMYGMEVTNGTASGGHLFPALFYFDNTSFTITQTYQHPFTGEKPECPWPASGQSITFGYGVGPGAIVAPFSFYISDQHKMETGFFKLIISNKPVDLQSIVREVSPFHGTRGMFTRNFTRPRDTPHYWASITIPVLQRQQGVHA